MKINEYQTEALRTASGMNQCIRYHMGAFTDKTEWNDYTRAVHNYANVLWTHQADMMASHVLGV